MHISARHDDNARHYRTVTFDSARNAVVLIEQRLLPHQFKLVEMRDFRQTARAITDMIVRGAGAIGATAAYGQAPGLRPCRRPRLAPVHRPVPSRLVSLKASAHTD